MSTPQTNPTPNPTQNLYVDNESRQMTFNWTRSLPRKCLLRVVLYRLAIALGIVVATATASSAQPTYRLHNNGELWVSRADTG